MNAWPKRFICACAALWLILLAPRALAAAITWNGAGADNNWSTAANWAGGVLPSSTSDVTFNGTSTKNAVWDAAATATIKSLTVTSAYTGSISLGRSVTASSGWTFDNSGGAGFAAAGNGVTFSGSTFPVTPGTVTYGDVTFSSSATITGTATIAGTLTASSTLIGGAITLTGNWSCAGDASASTTVVTLGGADQTITGSGSCGVAPAVINLSGTLTLVSTLKTHGDWTWQSGSLSASGSTLTVNEAYAAAQTFTPGTGTYHSVSFTGGGSGYVVDISGTLNMDGTLTYNGTTQLTIHGGSINTTGDMFCTADATFNFGLQTTVVTMLGATPTITGTTACLMPPMVISVSGSLTLSGTIETQSSWTWQGGTLNPASTGTITNGRPSVTFSVGSEVYPQVSLSGGTIVGTMNVSGTLTTSGAISGGAISLTGNWSCTGDASGSSTVVTLGGTDQTITGSGSCGVAPAVINLSGTLTLVSTVKTRGNWTWQSGSLSASGSTLTVNEGSGTVTFTPGTETYHNVSFTGGGSGYLVNISGTVTMDGTLTYNGGVYLTIHGGAINTTGDMACSADALFNYGLQTTVVTMLGATPTITGTTSCLMPPMVIDVSGTLNLSGTIEAQSSWTWQGGALAAGTSTLTVGTGTPTFSLGTEVYNNVALRNANIVGTMYVGGTLIPGAMSGGTIAAEGNIAVGASNSSGTTVIDLYESAAQSLTSSGGSIGNPVTVHRTSGYASVDSDLTFGNTVGVTLGELRLKLTQPRSRGPSRSLLEGR